MAVASSSSCPRRTAPRGEPQRELSAPSSATERFASASSAARGPVRGADERARGPYERGSHERGSHERGSHERGARAAVATAVKRDAAPLERAASGATPSALEAAGRSDLAPLWFVGLVVLAAGFAWADGRSVAHSQRRDALALAARRLEGLGSGPAQTSGLNLERAGPRELRRLPGIGDQRALALARARWQSGAPAVFSDLDAQPGIGPITAGRVAAWLRAAGLAVPGQLARDVGRLPSEPRATARVPATSHPLANLSTLPRPDARGPQ
jgi:hypothetical protein